MRLSIPIYTFKAFPDLICPLMLNQVYSKNKVTMYPELQLNNRTLKQNAKMMTCSTKLTLHGVFPVK
jgi:hypothetical protein